MNLVLSIWRETSRNLDLTHAMPQIVGILRHGIPAALVCVRRLNPPTATLDTVAVAGAPGVRAPSRARTACAPEELRRLSDWCRLGAVLRRGTDHQDLLRLLVPEGVSG